MASDKASRRRSARRNTRKTGASGQIFYIESSALLAALLEHDNTVIRALRGASRSVTSALTLAEANRAVVRARVAGRLTTNQERSAVQALQTFERRCSIVAVSVPVLARAGHPFPVEPIRTLEAIHLATVEVMGEPPQLVTVVTRDARVRENAIALGYAVT